MRRCRVTAGKMLRSEKGEEEERISLAASGNKKDTQRKGKQKREHRKMREQLFSHRYFFGENNIRVRFEAGMNENAIWKRPDPPLTSQSRIFASFLFCETSRGVLVPVTQR